ncbi:hypothetical protein [Nakamurella panacisegetis]|uniref:hypothetical protein n=1 Tax=Nakamurella panacisegetis TaxID=1090615 RepID=UPI0012FD1375|nr:hypothetical protein [Nakamurella panacisegetis]
MSAYAFVDETFRDWHPSQPRELGYYQLTGAVLNQAAFAACRNGIAKIAPGGFHATELVHQGRESVVETMLEHIAGTVDCTLITLTTDSQRKLEPSRQRCLEELLVQLHAKTVTLVIADSREAIGPDPEVHNRRDVRTFNKLQRAGAIHAQMRLRHQHDSHESLLCVPDAVGWAFRQNVLRGNARYWDVVKAQSTVFQV